MGALPATVRYAEADYWDGEWQERRTLGWPTCHSPGFAHLICRGSLLTRITYRLKARTPPVPAHLRFQPHNRPPTHHHAARYQREPSLFEWFFGHTALRRILRTHLSKKKPILHVGCGTSNLQEGMARSGYTVVNVSGCAGWCALSGWCALCCCVLSCAELCCV
jgi:hypothetical protein